MSHIKDRLSDYHDFMKKLADDHQMVLSSDVFEMIEQLKDDMEQDEKENGWIPVKYHQMSEKSVKKNASQKIYNICLTAKCQMTDKKYWLLTEKRHGKIYAALIQMDIILIAIMIGLRLRHGERFQNHIRRTK